MMKEMRMEELEVVNGGSGNSRATNDGGGSSSYSGMDNSTKKLVEEMISRGGGCGKLSNPWAFN